jgi:hypothetical protein
MRTFGVAVGMSAKCNSGHSAIHSITSSARASSADGMVKPNDPLLIDARANHAAGRSLARDAGLMGATCRTVLESLGTTRA